MNTVSLSIKGRGTASNPPNPYAPLHVETDGDVLDWPADERPAPETVYYRDTARTIIAHNDSPDVGFTYSINAYRGCSHGCVYCYARNSHSFFGLSAGLDFETKIFVKEDAPELLRTELASDKYKPVTLSISGVTDCYQPVERNLQLTRRCLEVLSECRNPAGVITKSHLVTRDIDLFKEMAAIDTVVVILAGTTLDSDLSARMEPRASSPARRLAAVEALAEAGVPVGVMVAPVVPGLTDHEIPAILSAARP